MGAMEHVFVEFRAGKLKLEGGKLVPDSRKGVVRLVKVRVVVEWWVVGWAVGPAAERPPAFSRWKTLLRSRC